MLAARDLILKFVVAKTNSIEFYWHMLEANSVLLLPNPNIAKSIVAD